MFCRGLISSSGRPRLGPSSSAHWQLTALPLRAQPLRVITSLCFTFPFSRTQGLFHPFLPWRRRLGERRRHLSCLRPALCRRRAYPTGMPTPSLSLCCARRSTLIPNKTICIRIWIQLQYITYYLRFRLHELSGVHVYTHVLCWVRPWSGAESAHCNCARLWEMDLDHVIVILLVMPVLDSASFTKLMIDITLLDSFEIAWWVSSYWLVSIFGALIVDMALSGTNGRT